MNVYLNPVLHTEIMGPALPPGFTILGLHMIGPVRPHYLCAKHWVATSLNKDFNTKSTLIRKM